MGVPIIGCPCAICQRKEERLRSSALLTIGGKKLLIDAGPDFRRQALLHKVEDIDALILTHSHYDHIGGLEDLRIIYYQKKEKIPCYLSTETLQEWRTKTHITPLFSPYILPEKSGPCTIEGLDACAFYFWQKDTKVTGYRFGDLAYITDISDYEEEIFSHLSGISTLVISACNLKRSPLHLGLECAVAFAEKTSANKVFFTHLSHEIDTRIVSFPGSYSNVEQTQAFAYDGLTINFTY